MDLDLRLIENFIINHPAEVQMILEKYNEDIIIDLLQNLTIESSSILLSGMERHRAASFIGKVQKEIAVQLIASLNPLSAAIILRNISRIQSESILNSLSFEKLSPIKQLLEYSPDTIGAYCNPDILTFYEDIAVEDALRYVKERPGQVESRIFILSRDQVLVGYLNVEQLLVSNPSHLLRSEMKTDPPSFHADMNINILSETDNWDASFTIIPVINRQRVFLGVINKQLQATVNNKKGNSSHPVRHTMVALGELYQIGFGSIMQGLADIIWEYKSNTYDNRIS